MENQSYLARIKDVGRLSLRQKNALKIGYIFRQCRRIMCSHSDFGMRMAVANYSLKCKIAALYSYQI